ncbi:MAG TPA: sugar transferase [Verrucomicrobiae bacterium]|nr:sugar transferase [Verrucomicrobiae bacterium]
MAVVADAPAVFGMSDFGEWPRVALGGKAKRAFDFTAAVVLLIFLSPLLGVSCLAIYLEDRGSPIYAHTRIGIGGRVFKCLKLRSMIRNSDALLAAHLAANPAAREEWARTRKLRDDPRVTGFGRFIRKTSIDELPQLFNVLRGEMSLVGPRPIVADELARYDLDKVHYLRARPGLTGLWQVSGRSATTYDYRISLDKSYVLKWSFLNDIMIILKTVPAVLLRRGAV